MKRFFTVTVAVLAALTMLPGCIAVSNETSVASESSFDEIVASRRSVRDYEAGVTISEAQVRTLIETSMEAPSWANSQTTRYYVAMSEEKVVGRLL